MLNSELYKRLLAIAGGKVKIVNENQPFQYEIGAFNKIRRIDSGESYRLCCPKCGDDRYRLYVNHRYGTVEPITKKRLWNLAHCLHGRPDPVKKDVRYPCDVTWLRWRLAEGLPIAVDKCSTAAKPRGVESPGICIPLAGLPSNHPAVQYIFMRGFNIEWIIQRYEVSFCEEARNKRVKHRLIFTFNGPEGYRGFQARAIPGVSPEQEPKWYTATGCTKSSFMFNDERAMKQEFVVITEGIFDALSCGLNGVCTFGKEISSRQAKLVVDAFRDKGLVIIAYDADASEFSKKAYGKLISVVNRVEILKLPMKDPGELGFAKMAQLIGERFNVQLVY